MEWTIPAILLMGLATLYLQLARLDRTINNRPGYWYCIAKASVFALASAGCLVYAIVMFLNR